MKTIIRSASALLALLPATLFAAEQAKNCGCECCKGKETCCCHEEKTSPEKPDEAGRHPLKGVIVDVLADQSALLVKHEEIPGYMPAMTMMFKVDTATLKAAGKGRRITATLVQRGKEFWLEKVQAEPATK